MDPPQNYDPLLEQYYRDPELMDMINALENAMEAYLINDEFGPIKEILTKVLTLPSLRHREIVYRARALVAFENGDYNEYFGIVESVNLSPRWHDRLHRMWHDAHYRIAEQRRGRSLDAVGRYRIRKRWPAPRTIWDGQRSYYYYSDSCRLALEESFQENNHPDITKRKQLAQATGLTFRQICNWFKNKRCRRVAQQRRAAEQANQQEQH